MLEQPGYLEVGSDTSNLNKRNINRVPWFGIFPDIFESMAESLNFTFELVSSRDGNWGSYNKETESWNGAIKDLVDGVADMTPSSITLSYIRNTAVDFATPIVASHCVFLVSSKPSFSWDIFSRPFHPLGGPWFIFS